MTISYYANGKESEGEEIDDDVIFIWILKGEKRETTKKVFIIPMHLIFNMNTFDY